MESSLKSIDNGTDGTLPIPRNESPNIANLGKSEDTDSWPKQVRRIEYESSADETNQPAMFYAPSKDTPRPLLVAFHTWGGDYNQSDYGRPYAQWCIEKGWVFVFPNFRGSNTKPEATGSELVVKDIISAVEYAQQNAHVDNARIYLVGGSGGAHAALLMAGKAPDIWAGVSAWSPISDIKAWYYESKNSKQKEFNSYADDISNSCGGVPLPDSNAEKQCVKRSPLTYIAKAKNLPLDINTGIHDLGVPVSHSLNAFNILAAEKDRISDEQIKYFVENEKVPPELAFMAAEDTFYGESKVLLRRQSNNARITVFDGGHVLIYPAALNWLAEQRKTK